MDFTSLTGQLLSAGITRTLPPAPVSVDGHDRELSLWLPVEGEVEVAREDLASRAVIQFDEVAFGMGPDPHGAFISRRRARDASSDRLPLSRRGLGNVPTAVEIGGAALLALSC
jgi:hypothetical protein